MSTPSKGGEGGSAKRYRIAHLVIGSGGLLIGVIIIALLLEGFSSLGELKKLEQLATCGFKESRLSCPITNACQVGLLKKMCNKREDHHHHHHHDHDKCDDYTCVIENLADGSCCDRNDFCNLEDPTKTCLGGQCISSNVTNCKGYCTNDTQCSVIPVPFLSFVPLFTGLFCYNNACFTLVGTYAPFNNPTQLLNLTTPQQRDVANCLSGQTVSFPSEGPSIPGAVFTWGCSSVSPYEGFYRKRDLSVTTTDLPLVYYRIPGTFTADQYVALNTELNTIINALVASSL